MKITLILLVILMITSCKGQNSNYNQKTMNYQDTLITPPFDQFSEGEMDFRHSTENEDTEELKANSLTSLKSSGYKFPTHQEFKDDVLNYFKLNIDNYNVEILALNKGLLPYLAFKNEHFIAQDELKSEDVKMLNKMLFKKDKLAETYIKLNRPEIINDLVFQFGYSKNKEWIDLATKEMPLWDSSGGMPNLFNLLFGEYNIKGGEKLELRKEMLNTLVDNDYDLSQLSTVANIVLNSEIQFTENPKDIGGLLIAKTTETQVPQYEVVEELYENDPDWITYFKEKDYYGSENLRMFTENYNQYNSKNNYGLSNLDPDYEQYGIIQDSDGYTNLRKEKSSKSDVIQQIPSGTKVAIAYNQGEWWTVVLPNGTRGFVHKSRIKVQ